MGFEYAWFRECASYDPIIKDLTQKVEWKSVDSEQTEADVNKKRIPINQIKKAGAEKTAGDFAAPGSVAEEDVNTLLTDLDGFMEAFTYEETEPVHVGEGEPGEEQHEKQIQQKIQMALESKDPGAVRDALQSMSSFLEMFEDPDSAMLQSRVTEALESQMPEQGMSPFEDEVTVDETGIEGPGSSTDMPSDVPPEGGPGAPQAAATAEFKKFAAVGAKMMAEMAQAEYGKPLEQLTYKEYHRLVKALSDEPKTEPHVIPFLTEEMPGLSEAEKKAARAAGMGRKADALPSADPESVSGRDYGTGPSNEIREWCRSGGHYAEVGTHHPTHDWCTMWNVAVEDLVMLPSGAVVPRSMAYSSSESGGEGGPHQFGRSPNQSG